MGKAYSKELEDLRSTYNWAKDVEINTLTEFILCSKDSPLISIGSGGSFVAATFATTLHNQIGSIGLEKSPLDIISSTLNLRKTSLLFITARGRNSDIITALKIAIKKEPKEIMILCANISSPIVELAKQYDFIRICELNPPFKKDGFLATNSLMTFCMVLLRAYQEAFDSNLTLPNGFWTFLHSDFKEQLVTILGKNIEPILNKDTLLVLHGKWGKPAAIDSESRFSEAALGNIQVLDFRNFAHGRHNWLAKRPESTGIIAIVSPMDSIISEKTLNLIPKEIPVVKISTSIDGPVAALNLLVQSLYLAKFFGESKGIDPGKPHVPKFGRKLYHLRIPKSFLKNSLDPKFEAIDPIEALILSRKLKNVFTPFMTQKTKNFWHNAYCEFLRKISKISFKAVVLDYDGTLCAGNRRFDGANELIGQELTRILENGLILGIATGRGKSVKTDLQKIISPKFWSNVLIGYYNGADIGELTNNNHPNKNAKIDEDLINFQSFLEKSAYLADFMEYELRPKQITFSPKNECSIPNLRNILASLINKSGFKNLRAFESTHTVDILAPGVSKVNLVNAVRAQLSDNEKQSILCIGDKGEWPGNDCEMLSAQYSLSVDTVSDDPFSCWNLAPLGCRGPQATLQYFRSFEFKYNSIKIDVNQIGAVIDE